MPEIDLFASRVNSQLPRYCSWKPDPYCSFVDAFSLNWSEFQLSYIFPPFSLLGRCVQKIRNDQSHAIIITPVWPTQPCFNSLMEILVDYPVVIQKRAKLLTLHNQEKEHPLLKTMKLMACFVSGNLSEIEDFQSRLQTYSCPHGDKELKGNTMLSLKDGFSTVIKGKYLPFYHLWKM